MNVLDVPKHRRIFMGGFLSWRTLISTLHPPTRTESDIPRSQSLHRPSIQHVSLSHELSPPLPSGSNVVIQLMEEILHQLIGSVFHYLQGFMHPRWLVGFLASTVRVFSHVVNLFFPVVDQFQVNRFNPLSYSKMSTWLKSWFGACVFVNFPVSTYQKCGCISIGLLNTSNIQCSISAIQQNGLKFTAKTQGPIYIQSL